MLKKIRRTANIGLYGSLGISLITMGVYFLWNYRFYANDRGFRFMLIAGAVLAVLALVTILFTVRTSIPKIRQLDDIEERMKRYQEQTANIYYTTFAIVTIECVLITLSHNSTLFMLLLVLVLMLFLLYPNSVKVKVDLGLTEEEATQYINE